MGLDKVDFNLQELCGNCCLNKECKFGEKLSKINSIFDLDYKNLVFVCANGILNNDECKDKISERNVFIRMSRYTTSIFKNISLYVDLYTEIIKEMISNHTSYPDIIFYILDIKFSLWKIWLECLLYWNRQLGIRCKHCPNYKQVIKLLSNIIYKDNIYMIENLNLKNDIDSKIQRIFLKTHKKIYEYFIENLLNKIMSPKTNGEYHEAMRIITDTINYWMTITVFELINIESILSHKKIVVSGVVVSAHIEGYNIIDIIVDTIENELGNVEIDDILFTTPDIFKYKYMFVKFIKDLKSEVSHDKNSKRLRSH